MSNPQEKALPPELSQAKEDVKEETKSTDSHMPSLLNRNSPNTASTSESATQLLLPMEHKEPKIIIVDPDVANILTLGSTSLTSSLSCGFYDKTVKLAAQMFGLGIQKKSKCIEQEKPKRLDELPDKLINRIVDHLDLEDRIKFRRVCKRFHALIIISYDSIIISCNDGKAMLKLDNLKIFYIQDLKALELETVENANYRRAIEALKSMLLLPNLTLKNFTVHFQDRKRSNWAANLLLDFLKSQDASLSVNQLAIGGLKMEQIYQFLQYFLPGVLKSIRLRLEKPITEDAEYKEILRKISALEQWKQSSDISMNDMDGIQNI
ncbi:hypothetical protein CAEBREN_14569 [Caenorhabditis brenneri]|uniref:F-box domain-containing protein n=1 Tax=Caenorhabditis brenneri TaxID=135651 RepID=G0N1X9_CAEBE|nr:hypothetical protein CAEBREN_14569 [Caenorhabditis brenneri]